MPPRTGTGTGTAEDDTPAARAERRATQRVILRRAARSAVPHKVPRVHTGGTGQRARGWAVVYMSRRVSAVTIV